MQSMVAPAALHAEKKVYVNPTVMPIGHSYTEMFMQNQPYIINEPHTFVIQYELYCNVGRYRRQKIKF